MYIYIVDCKKTKQLILDKRKIVRKYGIGSNGIFPTSQNVDTYHCLQGVYTKYKLKCALNLQLIYI